MFIAVLSQGSKVSIKVLPNQPGTHNRFFPMTMKILHLLSQRPECTGSGVYLQNIIDQARRAGHRNMLLAGIPAGPAPVLPCLEGQDSSYLSFSGGDLPFPVAGMSDVMPYTSSRFIELDEEAIDQYQEAFSEKIRAAVDFFRPDLIHSHHLWLMTSTATLLLPDLPMVCTCHSTDLRQYINCPHLRERVTIPCRNLDRVMALNDEQAASIATLYGIAPERIRVVGGGYNEALFVGAKKSAVPPCEMVYAGKLSRSKGVPWLLRAMQRLDSLPLRLHLCGSGSGGEEEECQALAAEAGGRVILHGRVSQQELAELLGRSHLFVLPSLYEGLPLVLLEALACGCRIVTTNLPGCRALFAEARSDLVEMLVLPPLEEVDKPFAKDWPRLEAMLAEAISRQVGRVMHGLPPNQEEIAGITAPFTWHGVFARIQSVYVEALELHGVR